MFLFTLALELGRTVAELEDAMTAQEFGEWQAYYGLHPFGASGGWFRTGVVASTIANVNRSNGSEPFCPADFIPGKKQEEPEDNPADFFGK